ncbi:MAG: hypothetical protein Nk1A_8120 [Endomicrobiia bacterium]|nr:MAG: hypothetical protein Nk1A_8120 [Endomicrobiia bacterium]
MMGEVGVPFNVLDIIASSKHFSEMWKAFVVVHEATKRTSIKYAYGETLIRELIANNYIDQLTEQHIGKVNSFLGDCFINKYFTRAF